MEQTKRLVIVGDSAIAEVAFEYFTCDSTYEVVAFAVEREFLKCDSLFGLPVVSFEDVANLYPPADHEMFVAVGFGRLNRVRARLFREAKQKGYRLASYVSSKAFVWRNVAIGENAFIFEQNVIQPFVTIGDDVVLWSGNHIGHHSRIGNHVFVSSHVVLSGFVEIGDYCFLGVNATVANNVVIGRDCLVGAGAAILKNAPPAQIFAAESTVPRGITTLKRFGIGEDE